MSNLSDFLNENGLSADAVVAASKALETLSTKDRALRNARATARRNKKSYDEAGAAKPASLGHGISLRLLGSALEGKPLTRVNRLKVVRAVNALLKSAKKDEVQTPQLFADVPARKGKAPKGKKK